MSFAEARKSGKRRKDNPPGLSSKQPTIRSTNISMEGNEAMSSQQEVIDIESDSNDSDPEVEILPVKQPLKGEDRSIAKHHFFTPVDKKTGNKRICRVCL